MNLTQLFSVSPSARRGGAGQLVGWFIRVVIYDMIITGISGVLGVPRMVALLIFLGILLAITIGGFIMRKRMSSQVDDV